MKQKNPNEYAFAMERYLETGILGSITGQQVYENENDQISQIKLDTERTRLMKEIQQLQIKKRISDDNTVEQQIYDLKNQLKIIEDELNRRQQKQFDIKAQKIGTKTRYNEQTHQEETMLRFRRQK